MKKLIIALSIFWEEKKVFGCVLLMLVALGLLIWNEHHFVTELERTIKK